MKKLHLICNAHLDPIWQWDWEEGAAAALATFQSAVDLSREYDYIFCHNEVTLYKYVEEYAPQLFKDIQKLVQEGKWFIMGGWYLQPDCIMPTGESLVRQIQVGKQYFKEKFGTFPSAAMNVDSFGHSIGLVQIIKKCGQDSYLCVRPQSWLLDLESENFWWKGLDGSLLKCHRAPRYNSPLGGMAKFIKESIESQKDEEIGMTLWGVGNHGGGPSRKDLGDIAEIIKNSDFEIVHSNLDDFFAEIKPDYVFDKSLLISNPGCYTSSMRFKQKHIELEEQLSYTEKIMSAAALSGVAEYKANEIKAAEEDLLNGEFHDVLPGSSVKKGETNGIEYMNHALRILNGVRANAFFALAASEPRAKAGEYPVLVFNPHPYEVKANVEVELNLADQQWDQSYWTTFNVTLDGETVASQVTKEESMLNLDWRKKVIFEAKLKPMQITRFSLTEVHGDQGAIDPKITENIVYQDEHKYVEISKDTGLLTSYKIDGKEYIDGNAFELCFYDDNADPWAMENQAHDGWHKNPHAFTLEKKPDGVFKNMSSIQRIEDGDIYLGVEAFFKCENTRARIEYRIYKNSPEVDVNVTVLMGDVDKMLKLRVPVKDTQKLLGQCPFGTDTLFTDGRENISQRFIASRDSDGECLEIINNCCYGSSFSFGNTVEFSLLRGAGYCVHPIDDRPLMPANRYIKRMDQGESSFSFRIMPSKECELEKNAREFNQKPYALNVFPTGTGSDVKVADIKISNPNVVVQTIKKGEMVEGYVIRLLNNYSEETTAKLTVCGVEKEFTFGRYEAKTVVYNGDLVEYAEMLI